MRNDKIKTKLIFVGIIAILPAIILIDEIRVSWWLSINYTLIKHLMLIHYQQHWWFMLIAIILTAISLFFIVAFTFKTSCYHIIKVGLIILLSYSYLTFIKELHHYFSHDGKIINYDNKGMHQEPMTVDEKWEYLYKPVGKSLGISLLLGLITWIWSKTDIRKL